MTEIASSVLFLYSSSLPDSPGPGVQTCSPTIEFWEPLELDKFCVWSCGWCLPLWLTWQVTACAVTCQVNSQEYKLSQELYDSVKGFSGWRGSRSLSWPLTKKGQNWWYLFPFVEQLFSKPWLGKENVCELWKSLKEILWLGSLKLWNLWNLVYAILLYVLLLLETVPITLLWGSIISNSYGFELSVFGRNRTGDLWITIFVESHRQSKSAPGTSLSIFTGSPLSDFNTRLLNVG